jgi:tRNA nucleotidyltransferase/poly(A) polymerase
MRKAASRIVEKLRLHGHEAFFAGGWVRDILLGRKPQDIDIATNARPDEVLRLFPRSKSFGAQFGVIRVSMYGHAFEIATFRSDNAYLDGRHPSSVTFSSPEQDALRRDFTINGLFYDPVADRVIDYVQGANDIRSKLIRTIGNPDERFAEDKLRMLRAVRFACTLGFRIVPETWESIRRLAPGILQVSWERIREELTKILTGPDPAAGFDLLHRSGLLTHILPEVEVTSVDQAGFTQIRNALELLHHPSMPLAFAVLFLGSAGVPQATAEQICRRLRMSNEETSRIVDLVSTQAEFSKVQDMRESALKKFLRMPHIADQLELYRVHCISSGAGLEIYDHCRRKLREYSREAVPAPLLSGEDLIAMGYSPGPVFKHILQTIEDLQLEGTLRTREEALAHVKAVFPSGNAGQIPRSG